MTQPQTTAKKTAKATETKTATASDPKAAKATENKMKEFEKAGETALAKDKRKASAKKTATRKKAPVKKAAAKKASPKATAASPKAKAPAKPKATPDAATPKPNAAAPTPDAPKTRRPRFARGQDPRIPPAGTTIVRPYKGEEIRVTVLEDGFRWKKQDFSSLSACAKAITGTKGTINGVLWFRLTDASGSADPAAS
jgi:hypothetical protein